MFSGYYGWLSRSEKPRWRALQGACRCSKSTSFVSKRSAIYSFEIRMSISCGHLFFQCIILCLLRIYTRTKLLNKGGFRWVFVLHRYPQITQITQISRREKPARELKPLPSACTKPTRLAHSLNLRNLCNLRIRFLFRRAVEEQFVIAETAIVAVECGKCI